MIKNFVVEETYESTNGIYNYCSLFVALANGVKFGASGLLGNWIECIKAMGKWYESNISTYQTGTDNHAHGRKGWYKCSLLDNKEVADDCSGFVQACLRYYGVDCPSITTSLMQEEKFQTLMSESGFTHMTGTFDPTNLQEGDIICGKAGTHTEIYAGDGKSWSWGSIHDGKNGHSNMPSNFCKMDKRGGYIHCWRLS